ncbi:hypothetical protein DOTSEDRAFT_72572 [Dothistroma septosporum NZE10]|uniref:Uncharacterized protein n=1 Tax=Dothistroma septosporum (strain NZE10 / CBS 128990) TaxID=675120 RepID=M2YMQ9_DOTSN|nr:hypothetical protein DOTSEDRAFT_72572 [Dothistroma septosporum NZE10]
MADQLKNASSDVQEEAKDTTKGTPLSGAQEKVKTATDGVLGGLESYGSKISNKVKGMVDYIFPPDKRASFLSKLQAFMLANPKLSAFLGMNLALTGVPLGLFVLFSLTVFIFALVVALVIALLAAVLFTLFAVGTALLFVFPAVLFTTGTACFLFLWGLGGYYILRWANGDKEGAPKQAPEGHSIGDSLNRITGGRLDGFMQSARSQNAKNNNAGKNDRPTKQQHNTQSHDNGTPENRNGFAAGNHAKNAANDTSKYVGSVSNQATDAVSGATKPVANVSNTAGTIKGGLSGASGLGL